MIAKLITNIISKTIMFLCRVQYKKYKQPIMYIRGSGRSYPSYMLYTEDACVYQRMEEF